jgi:UPF0716 family protein affecting phage T7 exclusion
MNSLWLKFRIWTKVAAFAFLLIYALTFIGINYSERVKVWLWIGREPEMPVLLLVFFTFLFGVIGTILVRTTLRTIRQIKELRTRSRTEKMERQVAEMQAKAGRLQTRPSASAASMGEPPADPL